MTNINLIGVCGAGAMGSGIAQIAARSGHSVTVFDVSEESLRSAQNNLDATMDKLVSRGKLTQETAEQTRSRISWSNSVSALSGCDLVVEAIVENIDIKSELFAKLETTLTDTAVIATNTSSLSVSALASKLKHPSRFMGLHFFNPAPIMKLVEIVPGRATDESLISTIEALMRGWNKTTVIAKDVPGFIVNRVARPFYSEGWQAYEEGVGSAETLDYLYREVGGFRMGPLELGDLIGHDINFTAASSLFAAYFGRTRFRPSILQRQLVDSGFLGRKTGKGVYGYDEDLPREPSFADHSPSVGLLEVSKSGAAFLQAMKASITSIETSDSLPGIARSNGVDIFLATGRSAHAQSRLTNSACVMIDWRGDYNRTAALAYSSCGDNAEAVGAAFLNALDLKAVLIEDRPGGVIWRTLAQLANCAADAVRDKVCNEQAVDQAMLFGVNYPVGPIAWARNVGVELIIESLANISAETGDKIYEPSEGLRRMMPSPRGE